MKEIVKKETLEVEVTYTLEDCIAKYQSGTDARNEAIYEASKLPEKEFREFVDTLRLTNMRVSQVIGFMEFKNYLSLKRALVLNENKEVFDLSDRAITSLAGNSPEEKISNYKEVKSILPDTKIGSLEIDMYNALKNHAMNGEDLEKVPFILREFINFPHQLKHKLASSSSKNYKIKKLADVIQGKDEESVIYSVIDTGNKNSKSSSKEDRERIRELEGEIAELKEENELLRRRNNFLVDSIARPRIAELLGRLSRNRAALKKMKPELLDAFSIMGVDVSVNEAKLKKIYRKKVSIAHPDRGGSDEEFHRIAEANRKILNFIKGL